MIHVQHYTTTIWGDTELPSCIIYHLGEPMIAEVYEVWLRILWWNITPLYVSVKAVPKHKKTYF